MNDSTRRSISRLQSNKVEERKWQLSLLVVALLLCSAIVSAEAGWFDTVADQISRPVKGIYEQTAKLGRGLAQVGSKITGRSGSTTDRGDHQVVQKSNSSEQDYRAKCFSNRNLNLRKNPVLYFYSSANHSPNTLGCHVTTKIELKLNEKSNQEYQYSGVELDVDSNYVQEKLINTGLYNGSLPTYFLVHGFMAGWNSDNWMCDTKDLLLNTSLANVFIVDWSGGSQPMLPIDYAASVGNTQYVADLLAQFIELTIETSNQIDAKNFHLIGHSLGAHISGFVGYLLGSLGRITGLDPAGPCFSSGEGASSNASADGFISFDRRRLSPESADYVLALHTDTALFGLNENCGHTDVYVNGGHRQPLCTSINPVDRVNALLNLDFRETLDFNIACAHSYSQRLIDTFGSFLARGIRALSPRKPEADKYTENLPQFVEEKCFSMAYKCDNWDAYKAGECGFCQDDNDNSCAVYIGLNSLTQESKNITRKMGDKTKSRRLKEEQKLNSKKDQSDDGKFNEEDEDDTDDKSSDADDFEPPTESTLDQHFIKSDAKQPTCMFEYQLIVAANRDALGQVSGKRKHYYYLNIPLDNSGLLADAEGNRLQLDRLVQVSHQIDRSSLAYNRLRNNYVNALKSLRGQSGKNLTFEDVDFFTAMISFHQKPRDQCQGDAASRDDSGKQWQLCAPLNNLQEALLWSSSELQLDAVRWVSANYMSGLSYKQRIDNSYFFQRNAKARIQTRDEITEASRASLSELGPRKSGRGAGPTSVVRGLTSSLDCVTSFLDLTESGQARTNHKCNRSGKELKYAVRLEPRKLQEMTR